MTLTCWARLAAAALLGLSTAVAAAESRYDISRMTCQQVQDLLQQEGAALLSYPADGILGFTRYDRYVSDQSHCRAGEVVRGAGVPTLDRDYCPVRRCVMSDRFTAGG